jgi:hypothetical protein
LAPKFDDFATGLPDGIFSNQKAQFGQIFGGLLMEDVGIFYGHLVILWPFGLLLYFVIFGMFNDHLVYFLVCVCCAKKNLATLLCNTQAWLPAAFTL